MTAAVLLPGNMCDARLWRGAPSLAAMLHERGHSVVDADLAHDDTIAAMAARALATADGPSIAIGFSMGAIDLCAMAARASAIPLLVRPQTAAPEHILSALDSGADGVLLPHIRSAAQARAAAGAAHYGRDGRGYAGSSRAAGYATRTMTDHLVNSAARTVVIAQVEDLDAVDDRRCGVAIRHAWSRSEYPPRTGIEPVGQMVGPCTHQGTLFRDP